MSADPADRTATLQPTMPSKAPARDDEPVSDDAQLPIDNPERYEQIAEHARGGLGRVVRAVDERLGRTVAVKELLRGRKSTRLNSSHLVSSYAVFCLKKKSE